MFWGKISVLWPSSQQDVTVIRQFFIDWQQIQMVDIPAGLSNTESFR